MDQEGTGGEWVSSGIEGVRVYLETMKPPVFSAWGAWWNVKWSIYVHFSMIRGTAVASPLPRPVDFSLAHCPRKIRALALGRQVYPLCTLTEMKRRSSHRVCGSCLSADFRSFRIF